MVWLKIPLLVATNSVGKCPKISPKIPASDATDAAELARLPVKERLY